MLDSVAQAGDNSVALGMHTILHPYLTSWLSFSHFLARNRHAHGGINYAGFAGISLSESGRIGYQLGVQY